MGAEKKENTHSGRDERTLRRTPALSGRRTTSVFIAPPSSYAAGRATTGTGNSAGWTESTLHETLAPLACRTVTAVPHVPLWLRWAPGDS